MTILSIFHGGVLKNYESITSFATSDNGLAPSLSYIGVRTRVKFGGQWLKQEKVTFTQWNVVNIYIVYEKDFWPFKQSNGLLLWSFLCGMLNWSKMLILISVNILGIVLHLIHTEVFHGLTVADLAQT